MLKVEKIAKPFKKIIKKLGARKSKALTCINSKHT
jgi:hypothetical protein